MTLRVLLLRADQGGCAKYRMLEPAAALQRGGFDVEVDVRSTLSVDATRNSQTGSVRVLEVQEDVDLIVIQRPLDRSWLEVCRRAQRQGIAFAVELDDDFSRVHPRNLVWSNVQPHLQPHSNYEWLQRTCREADWVTVSTPQLAEYAPHGRVSVLPNLIPGADFRDATGSDVGWTGSLQTHPTDLQATRGGVARLGLDQFTVVGDGQGVAEALGLRCPVAATGWVPLEDYSSTLAERLLVGIVPLETSVFNEAKSALKGLEMAACGVPFVASPTGEYRRLEAHGVGELARSPGDWQRRLERLLSGERARRAGERIREIVRTEYLLEKRVESWLTAWSAAVAARRERRIEV